MNKKFIWNEETASGNQASSHLIVNKLRGTFHVVGVKAPGYGDNRKEMLQDIATLTGGQVISEDLGLELKDATMAMLGRAKSVKVQKENTVINDIFLKTKSFCKRGNLPKNTTIFGKTSKV